MKKPRRSMLVVATSPREGISYLEDALTSLDEAGADTFDHKIVVSDGPCKSELRWPSIIYPGPSGHRRAFWRTLKLLRDENVDCALYVEDDVRPCRNAMARISTMRVPDELAFISFHDMLFFDDRTPRGIYAIPLRFNGITKDYCGMQCLLLPRRSIDLLVDTDPFSIPDEKFWNPLSSADAVMGFFLNKAGASKFGCHVPSLVEHVGHVSAAHPGEDIMERARTRNFPGRDFDATNLRRMPEPRDDYNEWRRKTASRKKRWGGIVTSGSE